ncbi:NAD-dependent epimerase/dehydratase family protein [Paenibacillus sp. VT-400]|uniref:NAD-dependent epimerase/dehydratase family protein n=1 Tax=Paenibacillus sp. VT-400 TaxID=1495853 RepID=UPI0009E18EA5|nr:NAD(P)-dependent oxidoreductase [Paenibacillus sp. VT-400]
MGTMKVLITGSTSPLARNLYHSLSSKHEVFLSGRNHDAEVYIDFSDLNLEIPNLPENLDVIIHCVASFEGNSVKEAMRNEIVNSLGSFKIMQVAERTNCKNIIYISSLSTYSHAENEYFGSYGLSKRHGQENLEFLCLSQGINFTALLVSQIYDEHLQFFKHQGMFYRIIKQAYEGQDINIFGNKDPLRNYLHIKDLVKIISKTIDLRINGKYNCTYPRSYKIGELAMLAQSVFNKGGTINFLRDKPDIGSIYIPDDCELYTMLDYKPEIDLKQGIEMLKLQYDLRESGK